MRQFHRWLPGLVSIAAFFTLSAPAFAQTPGSTPPITPDPKLTPGATLPVTVADIAVPGYTQKVRNVPASVKKKVYAEYNILSHKTGEYEVDHLISLELGGSNSIRNLWPESYLTKPWNAHVKDQLENKLHDLVVAGTMSLPDAQKMISTDWIGGYKQVFKTDVPMTAAQARKRGVRTEDETMTPPSAIVPTPAASPPAAGVTAPTMPGNASSAPDPVASAAGQVWVNTKSGKYFRPGNRYYGKTKEGKYMTEDDAKKAGYAAAGG